MVDVNAIPDFWFLMLTKSGDAFNKRYTRFVRETRLAGRGASFACQSLRSFLCPQL